MIRTVFFFLVLCSSLTSKAADNVDTNASPKERVAKMKSLVENVVNDLDASASADDKKNIATFLMRVAFHEGARLKERRQIGSGPGRSFFQFEPGRAKDAVDYAFQKSWSDKLAKAGETTADKLKTSAVDLVLNKPWPTGSHIENLLGGSSDAIDLFGIYMARIAFKKVPASIPKTLDEHADYWAKYWKVKFDSDEDRKEKIKQFKANAEALDML